MKIAAAVSQLYENLAIVYFDTCLFIGLNISEGTCIALNKGFLFEEI